MSPLLLRKLSGQHDLAAYPERETGEFGMYLVQTLLCFLLLLLTDTNLELLLLGFLVSLVIVTIHGFFQVNLNIRTGWQHRH